MLNEIHSFNEEMVIVAICFKVLIGIGKIMAII